MRGVHIHRYFKDDVLHEMAVSGTIFTVAKELFDTGKSYNSVEVSEIFPNISQVSVHKIVRVLGIMQEGGEFYETIVTHTERKVEY